MSFDWKKTVATVAPGIANLLGGPLAGMGMSALLGVFGIESTGDPAKDEELISQRVMGMTPADAIAMKKVEADLAVELAKVGVDIYKIEVEDRISARSMREKLGGDYLSAVIAVMVVGGWLSINYILFTATTTLPNETILLRTLGTLDAALLAVLYFLYGSSKGSSDKNAMTAKMLEK